MSNDDNRVIVQFCRLAVQDKDIILHSSGNAARPYCYTMDAISAILYILLNGNNGQAYNVANEDSYISAKDLALYIQKINQILKLSWRLTTRWDMLQKLN